MRKTIQIDEKISEVKLRYNPIIITVNNFDEDAARKFRDEVNAAHNTGQPVIPVVIASYGGAVYSLLNMIDTIESATLPIMTIAEGKAMSCGAVLLSCGTKGYRYAAPNSTIMIHDVSSMSSRQKVEELKADVNESDRLNNKIMRLMSSNCGKRPDYFLKEIHKRGRADWFLESDECLEIGLVDHVGMPEMKISVEVGVEIE